ncbi:hypothetical protein M011DRAFT_482051 [Sporormia fimetaria CBS 119925]|uniref:Uncharacterized protein n=1 Tax=Sporormia fimetaria CBS 119925 TaxID=1340428 RepID=A0A6A6UV30_9PLEO|nr:hypothetical protein M011DRAFT_482051 [Sporormia fimetaria CBS 119925]
MAPPDDSFKESIPSSSDDDEDEYSPTPTGEISATPTRPLRHTRLSATPSASRIRSSSIHAVEPPTTLDAALRRIAALETELRIARDEEPRSMRSKIGPQLRKKIKEQERTIKDLMAEKEIGFRLLSEARDMRDMNKTLDEARKVMGEQEERIQLLERNREVDVGVIEEFERQRDELEEETAELRGEVERAGIRGRRMEIRIEELKDLLRIERAKGEESGRDRRCMSV